MKRRFLSTLCRSRRVMRLGLSGAVFGLVLTSTPAPLAQELVPATLKSSAYTARVLIGTPLKYAQAVAERTGRRAVRLKHDAERKLRNARVTVNKTKPEVTKANLEVAFGADVATETLRRARVFAEPLVPTAEPSAADNEAVARLLESFAHSDADLRAVRLEQFLAASPSNPWRASILANAGTVLARQGYYSRAAAYWTQAWELARDSADPAVKAIADSALGESLSQMVTFGQTAKIETRLKEAEGRDVRGPAGVKVAAAREAWAMLLQHHEIALFSGPEALKMYLTVAPTDDVKASVETIAAFHPKREGTSLLELRDLAAKAKLPLQMVHTRFVTEIPVPSIVHLRADHFSAVIKHEDGKYQLRDPSLGGTVVMSAAALRDEASGYFLVKAVPISTGWMVVSDAQAASVVGHCTPGKPSNLEGGCSCPGGGGPGSGGGGNGGSDGPGPSPAAGSPPVLGGMPHYAFHPVSAALVIQDRPAGYSPPIGRPAVLELSYNHRDERQPQTFGYGHVGPLWTWNWLSYVTDNITLPNPPYDLKTVYLRGAGLEQYAPASGVHPISRAELLTVTSSPIRYERRLPDGTVEVFDLPDRAATLPNRRIFLSEVIDPQGHSLEFTYDSSFRLIALTDALGQVTELDYEDTADPLRLTKVTDPFGREAVLTYDALGRLATITDVMGMTSRFTYGAGDFITAMSTPYGTTTFRHEPDPTQTAVFRRIEATDPMGGTERLEYHIQHAQLSATEASTPTGFSVSNQALDYWNTLYWDKRTMAVYGADLSKALVTNWMIVADIGYGHPTARNVPHSVKPPLENRIWYRYPDQQSTWHHTLGTGRSPSKIGRVLEGGASQVVEMTYNSKGMVTSRKDAPGRETTYSYATNHLDLLEVRQVVESGTDLLTEYADYTSEHLPQTVTDAAGQETGITYNGAGQALTVTNALGEVTTYTYDSQAGVLETATGAVSPTTTTFTHDAYGRVETVTRPDGFVVTLDYDLFDRVTRRTYPDDTYDEYTFDRLHLAFSRDRLGRITRYFYDSEGRPTSTRDPAGRTITQVWCGCGSLDAVIDANGNRTSWERDAQGRVTREVRADGTTDTLYTYDATGRLKTITDPQDQVTTHSYNTDDSLAGTAYTNEEHETPNVSFTYETYYSRPATIMDGIGTTTYTYKAVGTLGAGQVATVAGPLSDDTIAYTYDELGRVVGRTINGSANEVTWTFDALGRVTSEDNTLGLFEYTYHEGTNRITTVTYPNDQTSTYSYFDDEDDFRLQTIHNKYPN